MNNDGLAEWERELLEGDYTPDPEPTPAPIAVWFTITTQMAVLALLDVLDRFGTSHTADAGGCIYAVKKDSNALVPVCIVGQVFADFGILGLLLTDPSDPVAGVTCASPENMGALVDSTVKRLRERGIAMEEGAVRILRNAQQEQDSHRSWGDSVEYALRRADERGDFTLPRSSFLDRAKAWQENL